MYNYDVQFCGKGPAHFVKNWGHKKNTIIVFAFSGN